MSTITTTEPTAAEQEEAREIVARALKLPPALRESVGHELFDSIEPPEDTEAIKAEWRAELTRRVDDFRSGRVRGYSREETMAYLHQALAERAGE